MKIKITIIEDCLIELNRLSNELEIWSKCSGIEIKLYTYSSGEEYFRRHQENDVSVFFLDIQLSGMSGMTFAKKLRESGYKGHLIFLTAFREYVFEGYQVHALNYLLKPITANLLKPCMDEIAKDLLGNTYVFRNKQEIVQIPYTDILVFTSNMHYVDILTSSKSFCQYTTLNNIIIYLPKEFIRCHRSYIVNMSHIYKIKGSTIVLSNNMKVPMGRSFLNQVQIQFSNYSFRFDKGIF